MFSRSAERACPVVWKVLKFCARRYLGLPVPFLGIINITAIRPLTLPFHDLYSSFYFLRMSCPHASQAVSSSSVHISTSLLHLGQIMDSGTGEFFTLQALLSLCAGSLVCICLPPSLGGEPFHPRGAPSPELFQILFGVYLRKGNKFFTFLPGIFMVVGIDAPPGAVAFIK